jgi:asparagine synthase (glutamine-hydrolysing)
MRRLSIIDLGGGHQPIGNEDGSVQVVFNGEIYNYRELRAELLARGHQLRTHSDTEVIAHLWEDYAEGTFSRLRGMFAIALWDENRRKMVLARDRLGIKPLYLAARPDGLDFASEMKVLLALPEVGRSIDAAAVASYFTVGYVPPPETVFTSIRELQPGHWLTWEPARGVRTERYWSLEFVPDEARSDSWWIESLDAALDDAVRSHLVADVPVAAFLSGGLDSSAVVGYMAGAMSSPARAYTIRYLGPDTASSDETPLAAQVARRFGADHVVVDVAPAVGDVIDDIVGAFDQPMADPSSVPTYYLTRAVARDVKVALSGLGGDELFGGYERHVGLLLSRSLDRIPPWAAQRMGSAARWVLPRLVGRGLANDRADRFLRSLGRAPAERYLGFITRLPGPELEALLGGPAIGHAGWEGVASRLSRHFGPDPAAPLLNRALAMDYGQYLPGDILPLTDRLSMLHSLEVRVPLVDHQLVEFAARIPPRLKVQGTTKKLILRKLLATRVPPDLLTAPKRGFVGPMGSWLRHELRDQMTDSLSARALRESGWLAPEPVQRMLRHHLAGTSDRYTLPLWSLMMFARWHERYASAAAVAA